MTTKSTTFFTFFILNFLFISTAQSQTWDGNPGTNPNWQNEFDNFNAVEPDDPAGADPSTITALNSTTWRINKPVGRKRAEASRAKGWTPVEGQQYYIKYKWRINATPNVDKEITVFQWKTQGDCSSVNNSDGNNSLQNYPFNLTYDGTKLALNAYGPGVSCWDEGSSINNRKVVLWDKSVAENTWVDIVIGVKISKNSTVGAIEIWFDGNPQILKTGGTLRNHRTNDGDVVYPKWGVYNANSRDFDVTVDLQNLKIDQVRPTTDLSGVYFLKNKLTNTYLYSDGQTVKAGTSTSGTDKRWKLAKVADDFYNIDNEYSDSNGSRGVLQANSDGQVINTNIASVATGIDKQWEFILVDENTYLIENKRSGTNYLAVKDNSTTLIETTTWNGNRAQWILEPVSGGTAKILLSNEKKEIDEDQEDIAFKLYPNPVHSALYVDKALEAGSTINVYNSAGSKILSKKAFGNDSYVDVNTFSKGVYILEIVTKDKVVKKKFIKE